MPDIADGRADYKDATRRAEEAAGIFRDAAGNEVYADPETPALPELEGAVAVAASDQPLAPEPVATDTSAQQQEPEPQPQPQEQSVAELQAEVARLQEQLASSQEQIVNKDSFIGRQSTDVGELRAEVDALRAQITAPQVVAPTQQITQEMIDNDPARATQLAFDQAKQAAEASGGAPDPTREYVLKTAFDAWKAEDEFTSGQWLNDRKLERQQAEHAAEMARVRAEVAEVKAPQVANVEKESWSSSFLEMQKLYPDFLEVNADTGKTNAQRLLEEVAPKFPTVAKMIAEGDVAAKVEGLTLLYDKGKLGNPAQVAAELQSAADDAAASAAAVRAAAATVNGQPTAGQGSTVAMTEEEVEVQKYKDRYAGKASLVKGWTGRSA